MELTSLGQGQKNLVKTTPNMSTPTPDFLQITKKDLIVV